MKKRSSIRELIRSGFRRNLIPGVILWALGLCLVCSYYCLEFTRPWFERVIAWKLDYGYLYSAASTAVFGGLIPFLYSWASGREKGGHPLFLAAVFIAYWGLRGMDVDAFYRLQAWLFGNGVDWKTIACKVVVDQFVYCLIWATPVTALFYGWKDCGYSWARWRSESTLGDFIDKVTVLILSTWLVWTPATAIVYSLPSPLQIPLFNLTLCFFVLLVGVYGKNRSLS